MGARTNQAAGNEGLVTGKSWSRKNRVGFRESRQTDASCQRFAPSSEAAAIGAGAIAETALNASACPAPN